MLYFNKSNLEDPFYVEDQEWFTDSFKNFVHLVLLKYNFIGKQGPNGKISAVLSGRKNIWYVITFNLAILAYIASCLDTPSLYNHGQVWWLDGYNVENNGHHLQEE